MLAAGHGVPDQSERRSMCVPTSPAQGLLALFLYLSRLSGHREQPSRLVGLA